jgi:heme oxygenase
LHTNCTVVANHMSQGSTTLRRLDADTRDLHGDVDRYWLDLMASGVTRDAYRLHLARVYGFEAPIESALAYTKKLVMRDRMDRSRSGLIAQDLLALGLSPHKLASLPQCDDIAPFDDPAEALGWKYVIERPVQLHSAIKRNIVSRVTDSASALSYLSAYDGVAPARWQQFGILLDSLDAHDRLVDAARTAFTAMAGWFSKCKEV